MSQCPTCLKPIQPTDPNVTWADGSITHVGCGHPPRPDEVAARARKRRDQYKALEAAAWEALQVYDERIRDDTIGDEFAALRAALDDIDNGREPEPESAEDQWRERR